MNLLPRLLEKQIEKDLFKRKVVILYGARQVGKTTLIKQILEKQKVKSRYLNCELLSVSQSLEIAEAERLKTYLGDYDLIVLDEAQSIKNIGKILKILNDTYPEMQIIATGSSSFDLANKTAEHLTGRARRFTLYPFSLQEIRQKYDPVEIEAKLENLLRFGSYPEVFFLPEKQAVEQLNEITSNYLYKDLFTLEEIKKSGAFVRLLQLLSLQLGHEVSYQEIASNLGINRLTVQKYIDLLEQSFIVFTLTSFSRNLRKEISKSVKVYFYDLGIRNSLIQNYNPLNIRGDIGALWENFCIVERKKANSLKNRNVNSYFWRTYNQKEIDYIEESEGEIKGFEFKWKPSPYNAPNDFIETYKTKVSRIDRGNYREFLD